MSIKTVSEFFGSESSFSIPDSIMSAQILRFAFSKDKNSMAIEIKPQSVLPICD